ncbi:hypothetical protein HYH03_013767 [Edaphochlamys debaryana]|uniref:Uncharacterized protein n=1 Tax=Edaphochlamys debaryana TaxID=47281 RepID=A0A835XRI0_9CHLO|nr:hypothetical protein HYH03_013767 [Edaphochlamys debaryana]|eukprot:KAG2487628.1 hypothetical protein HYH03_013767 [Edaphochlamys debaryana]
MHAHPHYPPHPPAAAPGAMIGPGASAGGAGALLHAALHGPRPGAVNQTGGTALYRSLAPGAARDKSLLAAAVDDALMSPAESGALSASVDIMMVDSSGGLASEALAGFGSESGSGAAADQRVSLGVVNLAAAAAGDVGAGQPGTAHSAAKMALYGNIQQARAATDAASVQNLRRITAAQIHQLGVVRQLQARQAAAQQAKQAAAAAPTPPRPAAAAAAAALQRAQQEQVLAAAAEVAQQVAARNAAALQLQHQHQRLLAATAAAAANPAAAAAVGSDAAFAPSALYKRPVAADQPAAAAVNAVGSKRPALDAAAVAANSRSTAAAAAAQAQAGASGGAANGTALYGAYTADRRAAASAATAVASQVLRRLSGGDDSMATSPTAPATAQAGSSPGAADLGSDAAFLDCNEDLGDEPLVSGSSCAPGSAGSGSGSSCRNSDDSACGSGSDAALSAASAAASVGAIRLYGSSAGRYAPAVSSRPYGLVFCPIVYRDVTSPAALALANETMARIHLPGGVRFMPLRSDSMLFATGVHWGFSAFALALGSSYFQRLLEITPMLKAAVRHAPHLAPYLDFAADAAEQRQQQQQQGAAGGGAGGGTAEEPAGEYLHKDGLRSILFTCAYLATKVVDRMPHQDMLRLMLSHLYRVDVTRAEAHSVELKCLEGLGYRLGPFFSHCTLADEPPCCDTY